jgi:hypothetical protein
VGKCAAPADEADHKYVLSGWIDARTGDAVTLEADRWPASGQSDLPSPVVAGPALLSLKPTKKRRHHPATGGVASKRPRPKSRGIMPAQYFR